jgi:protein-S-isoprenylcysteine O-methyltransferase Ste14
MPIDPRFQKNRRRAGEDAGVAIWGPVNPPGELGIRGTYAAVDWDLCTGCGKCLKGCPRKLYEWVQTPSHPTSKKKPTPARELECVQCYTCENECPVEAIRVVFPGPTGLALAMPFLLMAQVVGGMIYGMVYGPALGSATLFWLGSATLVMGAVLFFSIAMHFKKEGQPGKGKGVMDTTVLVETGTYALVRHPQLLGGILMMAASILVSQHWLAAVLGIAVSAWWYREAVREEKGLLVKFGDEYARYKLKVPRMNLILGIARHLSRGDRG